MWVPIPGTAKEPNTRKGTLKAPPVMSPKGILKTTSASHSNTDEQQVPKELDAIRQVCEEAGWKIVQRKKGSKQSASSQQPFGRQGAHS